MLLCQSNPVVFFHSRLKIAGDRKNITVMPRAHDVMITATKILCLDMSVKDNDKSFLKQETNANFFDEKA